MDRYGVKVDVDEHVLFRIIHLINSSEVLVVDDKQYSGL